MALERLDAATQPRGRFVRGQKTFGRPWPIPDGPLRALALQPSVERSVGDGPVKLRRARDQQERVEHERGRALRSSVLSLVGASFIWIP